MNTIIAKNTKGEGLLPMKQSEELESKKSLQQKNEELCNFIKNAFCISGDVSMVKSIEPIKSNIWFLAEDKERGNIAIMFKPTK
jgi:hypothetical protein